MFESPHLTKYSWLTEEEISAGQDTQRARILRIEQTAARARARARAPGLRAPVCLLGNDPSLSLSLSSRVSFSEFLQSTCIHIGKAKSPIPVFRRGESGSGEAIYIRRVVTTRDGMGWDLARSLSRSVREAKNPAGLRNFRAEFRAN